MRLLKRSLSETEISAAIRGVLTGLAYAHSLGRVDGIIMATGIMVRSDGQIKLDFGLTIQF
jgi:hypothetical protein